jgi:protein TonB
MAVVVALHLLLGWVLLQSTGVRQAVAKAMPVMVMLLAEATPQPPAPAPAPAPLPRPAAPPLPVPQLQQPLVVPVTPAPSPVPMPAAEPAPVAAAAASPEPAPAAAPVVAPAAPPAPPPPATPKVLTGSAVRYLVPPPLEVPQASRRAGEFGTVVLRVLVGIDGSPRRIGIHKTSGHTRLDEAAVAAMARARFKPLVEDGVAQECVVIAPLQFELD